MADPPSDRPLVVVFAGSVLALAGREGDPASLGGGLMADEEVAGRGSQIAEPGRYWNAACRREELLLEPVARVPRLQHGRQEIRPESPSGGESLLLILIFWGVGGNDS